MSMCIAELIRKLNCKQGEMYCKICTVDVVDEEKRVCDVSPIDGSAPLLDVNLQANQESKHGIVLFPKKGSYVVVGFLTPDVGVVLLTDEIEKIDIAIEETTIVVDKDGMVFNGGDNKGLVKIKGLTDKLNGLKDTVDALVKSYNGHVHAAAGTIDPEITIAPIVAPAQTPQPFNSSDYENDKIKH